MGATRRLVAIFYADVAGYSRLTGADEEGTHRRVMALLDEVTERIGAAGGEVLRYAGDAVLAVFPSVVLAVDTSAAIQTGIAERNVGLPEGERVEIRIGINVGDVIEDRGEVYGEGVNLAARLEAAAEPGGLCISAATHEQCRRKSVLTFRDGGEQAFKNIDDPVHVFHWTPGGIAAVAPAKAESPTLPDKSSIAVLPFSNMSGDPEQDYFSDGITEDTITELSRFRDLRVIARNSSFMFKGQAVDVKAVAERLGVAYVVEGSVRKSGSRVRVTAQLIEAATDSHIWAERYDRVLEDIFELQDELVTEIVTHLGFSLRDDALERSRARPGSSPTAYDHLLRARAAAWDGRMDEAMEYNERAVREAPDYAAAHAWLAQNYTFYGFVQSRGLTVEELARKAREHAEIALRLDGRDPFVNTAVSMAFCFTLGGDRVRGLRHSDTAISLNPHDFEIMYGRALVLGANGRIAEALDWLDRAGRLSPIRNSVIAEAYSTVFAWGGEYGKAIEAMAGHATLSAATWLFLAHLCARVGNLDEASVCIATFRRERPDTFSVDGYLRLSVDRHPQWGTFEERLALLRQAGLQE